MRQTHFGTLHERSRPTLSDRAMTFRIAVDTGGTFSDVVVTSDESRELWVNKALTT
jgi:hypothetical protein